MTVSYPRRQQVRRLVRAASRATGAAMAFIAAVLAVRAREVELLLLLVLLSGVLALASRYALRLAARSRVGAESEAEVRRVLEPLTREGWRVQHAVNWPGRGDLDHVVRSPAGMGFMIETKTLRYTRAHLARTVDSARWLARRSSRYPAGVCPVICVTRARRTEQIEEEVLVVSLDRLLPALRRTRPLRRRSWWTRRSNERETADHSAAQRRLGDPIDESAIKRPL